ncbi:hypothetical protein M1466_03145 [Candidatus Dependentiae bacterium]|nr:hypothetical protein [Candidatus Dependentiae bacterium]
MVVSQELLMLLESIMSNHTDELKRFLAHVLAQQGATARETPVMAQSHDDAHEQIVNFLSLLEMLMYEIKTDSSVQAIVQRHQMPAIQHIDHTDCDDETIATSVIKANSTLEKHPGMNPQEVLYKELLRRWKPSKKTSVN